MSICTCEYCGAEVNEARASFLSKEGRPITCITCQEKLEEEGEFETYVGIYDSKSETFIPKKTKQINDEDDFELMSRLK